MFSKTMAMIQEKGYSETEIAKNERNCKQSENFFIVCF
jgi:hypothetical protein